MSGCPAKAGARLDLDHYLEALVRKPGALPGATALEQARAAGKFTPVHDAWWAAARKAHGDAAGTRALIEVLLLHRHLPHEHVVAGLAAALRAGALTADAVALEARKAADGRRPARQAGTRYGRAAGSRLADRPPHGEAAARHPAAAVRRRLRPAAPPPPHRTGRNRQAMNANATSRGLTEQAADAAVEQACRMLRLPTIRAQFPDLADAAAREQMSYRAFLAELLMAECDDRARRRSERRIKAAGFPREKSLRSLRLRRQPERRPRRHPHPRHLRLGEERPAALPDRRQRNRQVPPAHRPGHRGRHGRATGSATPWPPSWSTSSSRPPTTSS